MPTPIYFRQPCNFRVQRSQKGKTSLAIRHAAPQDFFVMRRGNPAICRIFFARSRFFSAKHRRFSCFTLRNFLQSTADFLLYAEEIQYCAAEFFANQRCFFCNVPQIFCLGQRKSDNAQRLLTNNLARSLCLHTMI